MSVPQDAIQADWENREFVETISSGVRRIAEFLNEFGEPVTWPIRPLFVSAKGPVI
jgi:hypothetical protein